MFNVEEHSTPGDRRKKGLGRSYRNPTLLGRAQKKKRLLKETVLRRGAIMAKEMGIASKRTIPAQ